jgi:cobalt-zinc-cadmium efflux system outer membrane protein
MAEPAMLRYMLEQPLPTPGTLGMQERVAARTTERAVADLATLSRDLELEAARAYVMLWRAERELDVVATQSQLVEDLIAAALARMSSGADTHHDVIQSQVEVLALQNQTTQLRAERLSAVAMLNALRNHAASEMVSADEPLPLPERIEPEPALETEALRTRPELAGMTAMAGEERAMATLMRREGWPMFSVGAWYTQGLGMADSVGLMLGGTLPVFGASRQSSLAGEADARAYAAESDRTAMGLMIRAQVQSAYARYGAATERVSLLGDTALPRAEQALLQSQSSYRTGMMVFASVVQDERMLAELRMELIGARAERYDTYLALMRAVGRDLTGKGKP